MEPFQIQNLQYTTKIKIIDQTFNFQQSQSNTDVTFSSNKITELPSIKNVGDIVRLRRFQFQVNSMGELVGHSKQFSNWLIYSLNNKDLYTFKAKYEANNKKRELLPYEQQKFDILRNWALNLLQTTSILKVLWWKKFQQPNDENQAYLEQKKIENVDLVLKAVNFDEQQKTISFITPDKQDFKMILETETKLIMGQVVKLKNVAVQYYKDKAKYLIISTNSSCLVIPNNFFDAKCFEEDFFKSNKDNFTSKTPPRFTGDGNYLTKREVLTTYPQLQDFQFEEVLIGRKDLIEHPSYESISSDQLTMVSKLYLQRVPVQMVKFQEIDIKFQEDAIFQKFVVYGYIKQFSKPSEDNFHAYCTQCQKVTSFFQQVKKGLRCCQQMMDIALVMDMKLTDQTLRQQQELLVKIVLRKDNLDPFRLWKVYPDVNDSLKWEKITQESLQYFQTKLKAAVNHQKKSKFVVELKKSSRNQFFLELTDTIFCPQITYNNLQYVFLFLRNQLKQKICLRLKVNLQMPKKRRNNGRSKQCGHTRPVVCSNCGRLTPKDKCIKKFTVRDIVDGSSKDDIMAVEYYKEFTFPKTFNKLTYCVSCACHARIVKVRSAEDRKKRNVKRVVKAKKETPKEAAPTAE